MMLKSAISNGILQKIPSGMFLIESTAVVNAVVVEIMTTFDGGCVSPLKLA